jgi:hypothetical protein
MVSLKSWLTTVIGGVFLLSVLFQFWTFYRFVNQGPRFTAADGQALCQRVQALERQSSAQISPCPYGVDQR